jgi:hypothetical protein
MPVTAVIPLLEEVGCRLRVHRLDLVWPSLPRRRAELCSQLVTGGSEVCSKRPTGVSGVDTEDGLLQEVVCRAYERANRCKMKC